MAGGLFKLVKPNKRPQATDIQAAAAWGVAAFTTAVWIVQLYLCYYGLLQVTDCLGHPSYLLV
ncbi:hypothetical protein M8C21_005024 [Ambrosia artemisiifolia]|uniref:Uncharacterized protein n=1 Tax=Ambrosia artemisiifolia TaxID=4212 RepID=A0AAD5GP82_AMBAR|nr:hypothetical protein M8C21_005024 [Ambrosia artemisiifolia]